MALWDTDVSLPDGVSSLVESGTRTCGSIELSGVWTYPCFCWWMAVRGWFRVPGLMTHLKLILSPSHDPMSPHFSHFRALHHHPAGLLDALCLAADIYDMLREE